MFILSDRHPTVVGIIGVRLEGLDGFLFGRHFVRGLHAPHECCGCAFDPIDFPRTLTVTHDPPLIDE
jgi:hypothetical protein